MDTVGTFTMANKLSEYGIMTAIHKHYSFDSWKAWSQSQAASVSASNIMLSTGILPHDYDKLGMLLENISKVDYVCIDVANGYTQRFVDFLKKLREKHPEKIIVAGNVVTPEMTEELILSGADVVKVGIGPGSVCTTRVKTGVGYPQLSTVMECADAAHGLGGLVLSDGGCACPGDVVKAFAAGADFVMLGGMLAGHKECEPNIIEKDGKSFCEFYGMSSKNAMEKHIGEVAEYRASEGKCVLVPYRGEVA